MDDFMITDKFSNLGRIQNFIRFTYLLLQVRPPLPPGAQEQGHHLMERAGQLHCHQGQGPLRRGSHSALLPAQ